jgi:hypothetical protein
MEKKRLSADLEAMVDKHGLAYVTELLSEICDAKADHLASNWQDEVAAKEWETHGMSLHRLSVHLNNCRYA